MKSMNSMEVKLYEWTSDTLKKYVTLLGGSGSIALKGKRIEFICKQLLDKTSLRTIWNDLDSVTQQAISNAYHNGGEFNATAFVAQYEQLPPRPSNNSHYWHNREPVVFDLFVLNGHIPDDLMPLLTDLVLPQERFQLEGMELVPTKVQGSYTSWDITSVETELIGRTDLQTYLQLVDQKQVKFGAKNNRLTAASVRKVLSNLIDGDFFETRGNVTGRTTIRPFGLDVFAQESGLMTRTGKLTKAGREYLQNQDPELMLTAFEKWSDTGKFDELTRLNRLSGLKSRGTRLTPPASRREKIIEALSWCPVDKWINIVNFYRALTVWDFDFEVEIGDYTNLHIGSRHYGELYGSSYWAVAHGLYINTIIWEYLGTLGAVDIAFVDDPYVSFIDADHYSDEPISLFDGLVAFRINKWGAFLLGQADDYTPAQPKQKELFTIGADKELHLVADLLPNERLQLEMMATQINETTYQLSESTLLTAVESGQQLENLITFLQANHRGELTPFIANWLNQLKENEGAFKEVETAVLIQLQSAKLMSVVKEDKILASISQEISNNTILVKTAKQSQFRKRLKELGYTLS